MQQQAGGLRKRKSIFQLGKRAVATHGGHCCISYSVLRMEMEVTNIIKFNIMYKACEDDN